ncbi:hypothetical protein C8R46DRAFT_1188383 [Mycena filopes]|nr:hypothetical protein C8R46DRAFT_1188382 [Mycena filopes]KAJ7176542.1 hypothetical protein C8R46DRAFT_1188383 [Mycena filopes]
MKSLALPLLQWGSRFQKRVGSSRASLPMELWDIIIHELTDEDLLRVSERISGQESHLCDCEISGPTYLVRAMARSCVPLAVEYLTCDFRHFDVCRDLLALRRLVPRSQNLIDLELCFAASLFYAHRYDQSPSSTPQHPCLCFFPNRVPDESRFATGRHSALGTTYFATLHPDECATVLQQTPTLIHCHLGMNNGMDIDNDWPEMALPHLESLRQLTTNGPRLWPSPPPSPPPTTNEFNCAALFTNAELLPTLPAVLLNTPSVKTVVFDGDASAKLLAQLAKARGDITGCRRLGAIRSGAEHRGRAHTTTTPHAQRLHEAALGPPTTFRTDISSLPV